MTPPRTSQAPPLAGRRIVVTRAREQAGVLADALAAQGADVIVAPTIRIEPLPPEALGPLRTALERLTDYRWVVFTSANTVRIVCHSLQQWRLPVTLLNGAPLAAIGPATAAALSEHGVRADLVPERFVAEAVVQALAARGGLDGARILLPRALEARDALPDGLLALGATTEIIPVYRTVTAAGDGRGLAADLLAGQIDAVTFTSSSTVRHFVELVGPEAAACGRFVTAAIGPVTAATARELGLPVSLEADAYTVPGLVDALVRHFA